MSALPDVNHDSAAIEEEHLFCPIDATLDLLTRRYTLNILRSLLGGARRFNDIAQANHMNAHTLRVRLKELEDEEVVTRTVIRVMPPHVEYALTEKGIALNRIFEELADWGLRWMRPPAHNSSHPPAPSLASERGGEL